jgi:integrase
VDENPNNLFSKAIDEAQAEIDRLARAQDEVRAKLAALRQATPMADRVHRNVVAICQKAGVTEAPPHGLRGTHADLALTAAATPKAVSQALGHESLTTTYRHYADQGIAQQHDHQRAVDSLAPPSP